MTTVDAQVGDADVSGERGRSDNPFLVIGDTYFFRVVERLCARI